MPDVEPPGVLVMKMPVSESSVDRRLVDGSLGSRTCAARATSGFAAPLPSDVCEYDRNSSTPRLPCTPNLSGVAMKLLFVLDVEAPAPECWRRS